MCLMAFYESLIQIKYELRFVIRMHLKVLVQNPSYYHLKMQIFPRYLIFYLPKTLLPLPQVRPEYIIDEQLLGVNNSVS